MNNILKKLRYAILVAILALNVSMIINSNVSAMEQPVGNYLWKQGIGCPSNCGTGGDWFECVKVGGECREYAPCTCIIW